MRRRPGDELTARATLHPLAPGREVLPVLAERWEAGARGAVVFTDHADRTDPAALRAVLYGDSRLVCRAGACQVPDGTCPATRPVAESCYPGARCVTPAALCSSRPPPAW